MLDLLLALYGLMFVPVIVSTGTWKMCDACAGSRDGFSATLSNASSAF
jgi:hypothetical protein